METTGRQQVSYDSIEKNKHEIFIHCTQHICAVECEFDVNSQCDSLNLTHAKCEYIYIFSILLNLTLLQKIESNLLVIAIELPQFQLQYR